MLNRLTHTRFARTNATVTAALAMFVAAGTVHAAPPGVRHVDASAPAGGDGLSWATAYNDLREALITAGASGGSITELWVKEGVYLPGPAGGTDRTRAFTLAPDVGVYGGFGGDETARDQRDPVAHFTMLSGWLGGTVNVYNVVIGAGNPQTVLDGVTVANGAARLARTPSAGTGWAGGGIHITGSPTIRNCIITSNNCGTTSLESGPVKMGGGVYCGPGTAATFMDCVITANTGGGVISGMSAMGGGIAVDSASVHLVRCTLSNNVGGSSLYGPCGGGSPISQSTAGNGGGLYALGSSVLMESCLINVNRAGPGSIGATCGGGVGGGFRGLDGGHGGGLYSSDSALVAVNCVFRNNSAGEGGRGGTGGGSAPGGDGGSGGAVYAVGGDVHLVNCTLVGNGYGLGGAATGTTPPLAQPGQPGNASSIRGDAATRLENCISWNDGLNEIVGAVAAYSDIRGGYFGPGVINADPLFVDAPGGDYRLAEGSPCIDAGNSFPTAGALPATDRGGEMRRVDIAAVADTGIGSPVVDMGAHEVQNPCPIDYTGDGLIDFADYLEFLNLYDAADLRADLTGDGLIDFADYLEFLNLYDGGC